MSPTWFSPVVIYIIYTLVGTTYGVLEANKCLSDTAFYNDTKLQCECNQGYKGLGDLCCDDVNEYSNCNIGGDPWLSAFDGTQSPYNWPCVSRVAVVTGTTGGGNKCTLEVMTSATTVNKGAEYPDRIVVAFTIGDSGRQVFKFVGNTIQRPGDTSSYPASDLYRRRLYRVDLSGERIRISFVSSRDIWTIAGCDTKVTFRAAQNTQAVQYNRPGVCIRIKKSSDFQPLGLVESGDVCSASRGEGSLEQLAYKILVDTLKDYGNVGQSLQAIHQDYQLSCNSVGSALTDACNSDPVKIESAVRRCGSILYNGAIRMCLAVAGSSGPDMVGFFSSCLDFQCDPRPDECSAFVESYASLKSCFPLFCR